MQSEAPVFFFPLVMSHLHCNIEFISKDKCPFDFAFGSLLFIGERRVGGRLVMINRVALLML